MAKFSVGLTNMCGGCCYGADCEGHNVTQRAHFFLYGDDDPGYMLCDDCFEAERIERYQPAFKHTSDEWFAMFAEVGSSINISANGTPVMRRAAYAGAQFYASNHLLDHS